MKLLAIRLDSVGLFAEPVALEGLGGGLDVLLGPNELGKSTIFRSLRAVFAEKYDTRSRTGDVERLKPHRGGSPLVQCEFEAGGKRWSITKRFGDGRFAELAGLDGSGAAWRNADAEARLADLVRNREQRLSLLWVEQGAAPEAIAPGQSASRLLEDLVRSELSSAVDGTIARQIQARIAATLDTVLTLKTGKPRTGGPFERALRERDRVEAELASARSALSAAVVRLDEIAAVETELRQISAPETKGALAAEIVALERFVDQAKVAVARLRDARSHRQAAEARADLAAKHLAEIDDGLAALAAIEAADATAGEQRPRIEAAIADASARLAELNNREAEAERSVAETRGRLEQLAQHEREMRLVSQLANERRRLEAADAIEGERLRAYAALQSLPLDAAGLTAIEGLARDLQRSEARIEADAPAVRVEYRHEAAGRLFAEGRPLEHGETLRPSEAIEIEVEGIGRIVITPGGGAGRADLLVRRDREKASLDAALLRAGAASIEDARASAHARQAAEEQHRTAIARLADLVPEGLSSLRAKVDLLASGCDALDDTGPSPTDDRAALDALLFHANAHLAELRASLASTARQLAASDNARATLEGEARERKRRRAEIEARLPPAKDRQRIRAERDAAAKEAKSASNEAIRQCLALEEAVGNTADFEAAQRKLAALRERQSSIEAQIRALEVHRAKLSGELERDADADVAALVGRLEGDLSRANAEVDRWRLEIDAHVLLRDTMEAAAAAGRAHVLEPARRRMLPYLGILFPGAALDLGQHFGPEAIVRSGRAETVDALSRGTREQIAIIARLGYARLLAETGSPAPVVLDDALVFSDDVRLERMIAALAAAAAHHQVLVMACHEASLGPLVKRHQGRIVRLSRWNAARRSLYA